MVGGDHRVQRGERVHDQDVVVGIGDHEHQIAGTHPGPVAHRGRENETGLRAHREHTGLVAVGHNGPADEGDVQVITGRPAQRVDGGPVGYRAPLVDLAHAVDHRSGAGPGEQVDDVELGVAGSETR